MVAAALAAATIGAALAVAAGAAAGGDQMGWQMRWRRPNVEPLFNGEIWEGDATWSSMTAGGGGVGSVGGGCWSSGCGGSNALVVAVLLSLCLWRRLRNMVIKNDIMIENHMPCEGTSDSF